MDVANEDLGEQQAVLVEVLELGLVPQYDGCGARAELNASWRHTKWDTMCCGGHRLYGYFKYSAHALQWPMRREGPRC